MSPLLLLLLSLPLLPATADTALLPRSELNFDFGWRFRLGATAPPPPPPEPKPPMGCSGTYAFRNASASQCGGLSPDSKAKNSAECEANCCNDNTCGVWQWSSTDVGQSGDCWRGQCDGPMNHDPKWVGGVRKAPTPPRPPPQPLPTHPPEAQPGYNDSTPEWQTIQAPHDALIAAAPNNDLCPTGCSGRSYIPRYPSWYRKHFLLPANWGTGSPSSAVYLYFTGTFRITTIWVNGHNVSTHVSGYTSYALRLDDLPEIHYGDDQENVIALYIDPDNGRSGWWYEGSGLYRHVRLVRTNPISVAPDGLFAYSNLTGISGSGSQGSLKAKAVLHASVELNNALSTSVAGVVVKFTLKDSSSATVSSVSSAPITVPPNDGSIESATKVSVSMSDLNDVDLWQIRSPTLYTLQVEVVINASGTVDSTSTTIGFRSLHYDATNGMYLNGQHTKVRGFCDHNDFATFGMGVPDRIKLFRAQASRSVGGNGRRTSHNAPDPIMLDIYDRLGIAVMDENRQIYNESQYIGDMRDMVHRDRNHPSVTIWSFCNEAGCEQAKNQAGGPAFQRVTYEMDGSRPTLANMFTFGDLLSKTIDVQGFSHQDRSKVDAAHAAYPEKPIYMSECCSCNTMRGEDYSVGGLQQSFNAQCQQSQTNASNGVPYVMGTMVWTLFDYYGEPSNGGWPFVSSTFGAFDLAGFAKAASYWFRTQWLYGIPDSDSDKTFQTDSLAKTGQNQMVHIVEQWQPEPSVPLPSPKNQTFAVECDGTIRQQFEFSGSADGSTPGTLKSAEGLCLTTKCGNISAGCYPLSFVECDSSDTSQLLVYDPTAGRISASDASENACLDQYGNSDERSTKVGLFHCNGGSNQKWNISGQTVRMSEVFPNFPEGLCLSTADSDTKVNTQRDIHVYSSTSFVELFVNGVSQGVQNIIIATEGGPSYATFSDIAYSAGNLTAVALSANSSSATTLAEHTVVTSGPAAKLALSIDCPSPLTGTGDALYLDGQDAGLIRCSILDSNGNLAHDSNATITFKVVSGPGRIVGVHSGNPQSHEHNQNTSHSAYHGLARATVMVTSDKALAEQFPLLSLIDVDADHDFNGDESIVGAPIVVEASSSGLGTATISIPTSSDQGSTVLAAAEKYGSAVVLGFD